MKIIIIIIIIIIIKKERKTDLVYLIPGRRGIGKMFVLEKRGKSEYPKKTETNVY